MKRRGDEWKTRVVRLTTSQRSSLWVDLCRLLVANKRESHLRKQSGELVSFQRQRLHWIRLDYDLLVSKLLNNYELFIRVSHWPVVPSVKLVFKCAQMSRS